MYEYVMLHVEQMRKIVYSTSDTCCLGYDTLQFLYQESIPLAILPV